MSFDVKIYTYNYIQVPVNLRKLDHHFTSPPIAAPRNPLDCTSAGFGLGIHPRIGSAVVTSACSAEVFRTYTALAASASAAEVSSKGTALGECPTSYPYPYPAAGYVTYIDPAAFASASAAVDCAKGIVGQDLTTKTGLVVVRTCKNFARRGMDTMSGCDWGPGFGGGLAEAGVGRIGLVQT